MGRYIDEILQPGEKVLYSTNAHWIFYLPAIGAWILALILVIVPRETAVPGVVLLALAAAAVVALVALYLTVKAWFHRLTTETDVTNRRVVHKAGIIKGPHLGNGVRQVEGGGLDQSVMGRIFDYGN